MFFHSKTMCARETFEKGKKGFCNTIYLNQYLTHFSSFLVVLKDKEEGETKKPQTETDKTPHLVNLKAFISCSSRNFPWRGAKQKLSPQLFFLLFFFSFSLSLPQQKAQELNKGFCATSNAKDNKLKLTAEQKEEV